MFSSLLKELRSKKNISQAELSKQIGISQGNIASWETGVAKPGYDALIKLSNFFNISADNLLELSNTPDSPPLINPAAFPTLEETPALVATSVFSRLDFIIKERGLTLSRVEKECGLGNGTIKRWESQSPRLDKLVSVARFLNISLDFLVFGDSHPTRSKAQELSTLKKEQGLNNELVALSEMESDLIAMMRLLPAAQKKDLFDYVYFRYVQHVEQERGSIYSTYFGDVTKDNDHESGSSIA